MNNLNKFIEKLNGGKICIGAGVSYKDPLISELFCELGFDFLWIDKEHCLLDDRDVVSHIMATKGTVTAPFVRVTGNEAYLLKPMIEFNPAGLIFPLILTMEDAVKAVKSCRYPSAGNRGFGPVRSINYYLMDIDDYFKKSEYSPWVILQIEHIDAINNIDEILDVPGVNSIVIGPNDLANSIGLAGKPESTEVFKFIELISRKARERNIAVGFPMDYKLDNEKKYNRLLSLGINWFAITSDFGLIRSQAPILLEKFKAQFGGQL